MMLFSNRKTHRRPSLWVCALLAFVATAFGDSVPVNPPPGDDPPITVGAGWWETTDSPPAFSWDFNSGGWDKEGPFTFTWPTPTDVYLTDVYVKGDQFELFDFGLSVGATSVVPIDFGAESDPEVAFADPTYSSGVFHLGAGTHSLRIKILVDVVGQGRGYIKVEPAGQVIPEPGTIALVGLGLVVVARARRRNKRSDA